MRVAFHFQIQESGCQLFTRFVVALIHGRRSWCYLLAASWILAWTFVRLGVGRFWTTFSSYFAGFFIPNR